METLLNQATAGTQATDLATAPAVAIDSSGNYVAVWTSHAQDSDGWGVFGRRFAADGTPLGNEFQINATSAGDQTQASVAMDDNGNSVVTWSSFNQDAPGTHGVYARQFDATGTAVGGEFRVNTTTAGDQRSASVAIDDDGTFVIVWTSDGQDGDGEGVFGQRFDEFGSAVGGEFQVNTTTAANQLLPRVAANASGDFVVTWTSENQDGGGLGIFAQRFAASGAASGNEFQVNATSAGDQAQSTAALDAAGNLIVAWTSDNQDGDGWGVFARRFSSSGAAGAEFQVNGTTTGDQIVSSVAMDARGNFFVAWKSFGQDAGGTSGIYARQFNALGVAQTSEFLVNTTTAGDQQAGSVAIDDAGHLAAVWSGNGPGDADGVFAQLFNVPNTAPVNTTPGGQSIFEDADARIFQRRRQRDRRERRGRRDRPHSGDARRHAGPVDAVELQRTGVFGRRRFGRRGDDFHGKPGRCQCGAQRPGVYADGGLQRQRDAANRQQRLGRRWLGRKSDRYRFGRDRGQRR